MISYKKRAVEGYRNLVKKRDQSHLNSVCNGRFQKKTIPLHGWLFGIPRAKGGGGGLWTGNPKAWGNTYDWNSEGRRHWGGGGGTGGSGWNFEKGQPRVYSLKTLILWTLIISSQIKHNDCRSRQAKTKQNVRCTSSSRGLNATKHPFFHENNLLNRPFALRGHVTS